ncbi:acetyl esterase/lipase [Marmoricola sp. OAE513]|uniref:alpha/beta hydrolase n=1 Tax=Marmoricola sp. OAE513 TaxID=2817894 RepID=UPI001E09D5C8
MLRVLVRLRPQRWVPPWVTLRLARLASGPGGELTATALRRHLPAEGWTTRSGLVYDEGLGRYGLLDLALPDGPGPHPVVVWVHGGGWQFGDKTEVLPYLELVASRGFAGAAVNYPLAPEAAYPAAPDGVRAALRYLRDHAAELGIDPTRIVIAGDSAGAQVAAEVAVEDPSAFRGALLFCGIFDPRAVADSDRFFAAGLESAMWSLARTRAWQDSPTCRSMTVLDRATGSFPPTFLSAGNADPLTRNQTVPFSARLRELGVPVDEYHPGDDASPVHHVYQFRLDRPEGAEALERLTAFLEKVLETR